MGQSLAKFSLTATLAASLAVPSPAATTTWQIDPAHTAAGFSVKHMMIATVRGQFKGVTGTVDWDDQDLTKSTVDVAIDAATVDTGEPKRDADLKSVNFLDVANHPAITFKSTKIERVSAGKMKVYRQSHDSWRNQISRSECRRSIRRYQRSLRQDPRGS